jgi:hypothetical protein
MRPLSLRQGAVRKARSVARTWSEHPVPPIVGRRADGGKMRNERRVKAGGAAAAQKNQGKMPSMSVRV